MVSFLGSTIDIEFTTACGHEVYVYTYLGVGPRCFITTASIEAMRLLNSVIPPPRVGLYSSIVAGHILLPVLIGNARVQLLFQVVKGLPEDKFAFIPINFQAPHLIHLFPERETFSFGHGPELDLVIYNDEELTIGFTSQFFQLHHHLNLISSLED